MKKFVAIVLMVAMIMAIGVTASAEEIKNRSFTDKVNDDFKAYLTSLKEDYQDDITIDYESSAYLSRGHIYVDIEVEINLTEDDETENVIFYITVFDDGSYIGKYFADNGDTDCVYGYDYTEIL